MTEQATTEAAADTTNDAAATSTTADTTATAADTQGQAATEGQTTEATAAEGVKTEGDKGAPETYEFTAAEGREFDPAVIAEFSAVAKELNLPQEAAQKVLDKMGPAIAARQEAAIADARAKWITDTKADAEMGGPELAKKIALANTTFEKFGTPELRALLDESGLGDHPEMLRWAHRVGKAMSEDGFVAGSSNATDPATPQKLYSASNMNP